MFRTSVRYLFYFSLGLAVYEYAIDFDDALAGRIMALFALPPVDIGSWVYVAAIVGECLFAWLAWRQRGQQFRSWVIVDEVRSFLRGYLPVFPRVSSFLIGISILAWLFPPGGALETVRPLLAQLPVLISTTVVLLLVEARGNLLTDVIAELDPQPQTPT